jgi:DNA replication protein DnaC
MTAHWVWTSTAGWPDDRHNDHHRAPRRDSRDRLSDTGLKAPTLRELAARLAERARAENWSHEEYLAACLQREVSARESHGGEGRIRAAGFPARKSLEEFDFDHARGLKRDTIAHLGTLDFVTARENVVFLGPPGGWFNIARFSYRLCRTVQVGRV